MVTKNKKIFNNYSNIITYCIYGYIILQLILYLLLHTTDFFNYDIGCYSVIICGVLVSLFIAIQSKNKAFYLITLAQCFTLVSDTFLVLLDNYHSIAMISFCFTQLSYYIYILFTNVNNKKYHQIFFYSRIIISIILILSYFVNLVFKWNFGFLPFISLIYFSLLLHNILESCYTFKKNPYLTIGLILFMLCDICVGFYNLVDMFNVSKDSLIYIVSHSKVDWVWIFYHPSQVILSLVAFLDYKYLKAPNN